MNKRLIELYNQAGEFAYGVCQANGRKGGAEDTVWNSLAVGRFAELIVQECARAIQEEKDTDLYTANQLAGMTVSIAVIKNHLGVE